MRVLFCDALVSSLKIYGLYRMMSSNVKYVFLIYRFIYLCIYSWLCWVFVAVCRLSLVAVSGGYSSLQCAGFSLRWLLLSWSTGSRCVGSVVVVHGLSCSAACGIFPGQGSDPCPLHWQADSQPLHHQGSPTICFYSGSWSESLKFTALYKNPGGNTERGLSVQIPFFQGAWVLRI